LVKLCICNSFYFFDCFVQNLHPQVQKVGTNLQYLYVFHILRPRVLNCILKCAIHDYNDEHLSKIIDVLVPHSFFFAAYYNMLDINIYHPQRAVV
jgi:hypothetical protein